MSTKKTKSVVSKILNISGWVLFGFIILIVLMLLFSSLFTKGAIFGLRAYTVLSGSMNDDFPAGSVIFSSEVNPDELKVGDIITFTREKDGETVTHKIGKIELDKSTNLNVFYTYGTATGEYDEEPVHRNFIQGKYVFHIVGLGSFIQFLKSPVGYIFLILIPFGILIVSQGISVMRNFKLYQEEDKGEIRSQRQQLQDERAETQRLLDELRAMQEQLLKQQSTLPAEQPVPEQPAPEQPTPEQPTPEQPVPEQVADEMQADGQTNEENKTDGNEENE